jgi:DNA-binding transcriptional LysR family regulator
MRCAMAAVRLRSGQEICKSNVCMAIIYHMNLAAIDLNLLLVFDALMTERHATRAGQRIGLSQPAVSAALNRLRGVLNDDLFVRRAGEMAPTPRALALAEPVSDALRQVEFAFGASARFDPATVRRDFTIRGVDYVGYLIIPPLMAMLANTAPGIVVRCLDAQSGSVPQLLEEGGIDLAIEVMHDLDDPVRSQFLLRERYVVIVSARHPDVDASGDADTFDLDLYCRLPHALHSFIGGTIGNVDAALAAINRRRHVALSVPHFFSIAKAVADSRMIATFPERLAARIAPVLGLRVYRAPIDLAPISLAVIWHRRNDSDAGQIWLRQQVMNAAQSLD